MVYGEGLLSVVRIRQIFGGLFLLVLRLMFCLLVFFFAMTILGFVDRPNFGVGPHDPNSFPSIIYILYNITHSLIIFGAIFLIVWMILKKPFLPLFAWGIHIILDIFTHSFEFFPTPFLWPISNFKIDAWIWGSYWIFIPNVILLIILYSWFFINKRRKNK